MVHLLNRQGRDTPQSHTQRSLSPRTCCPSVDVQSRHWGSSVSSRASPFWLPLYAAGQNILPLSLIFNLITGAVVFTLHYTFLSLFGRPLNTKF